MPLNLNNRQQTRTPAVVDCTSGMLSLFCALGRTHMHAVSQNLRSGERIGLSQEREDTHRIHNGQDIGYTPVRIANRRNVYP